MDLDKIIKEAIRDAVKGIKKKNSSIDVTIFGDKMHGRRIDEGGINRILSHGKNGFMVISANRSEIKSNNPNCDLTKEYSSFLTKNNLEDSDEMKQKWLNHRNKEAYNHLYNFLRRSVNYSYTPTYGGYHGEDAVVDSYEPSFIVYNYNKKGEPMDAENLKKVGMRLCKMFNQESFYWQAPNEPPVYLNEKGEKTNSRSSLNFKINRDNEMFYTTSKKKKRNPQKFTADIQFENLVLPPRPGSLVERKMRMDRGEFIID